MRLRTARRRTGITPVVAIVLLLMMTVALGGAVFAWFTQMQEDLRDRTEGELETSLEVKDLTCSVSGSEIKIFLKNTGTRDLRLNSVDMFVRMPDGSLNGTLTTTGMDWSDADFAESGGFDSKAVSAPLESGQFYSITVEASQAGLEIPAGGCIAE